MPCWSVLMRLQKKYYKNDVIFHRILAFYPMQCDKCKDIVFFERMYVHFSKISKFKMKRICKTCWEKL